MAVKMEFMVENIKKEEEEDLAYSAGEGNIKDYENIDIKEEILQFEEYMLDKTDDNPNEIIFPTKTENIDWEVVDAKDPLLVVVNTHKDHLNEEAERIGNAIANSLNHEIFHQEKNYICEICWDSFSTKRDVIKHKKLHKSVESYTCQICMKQFNNLGHFLEHKETHSSLKSYICDICMKQFDYLGPFLKHKETHASGESYSCEVCIEKFYKLENFLKHKETHVSGKSYSCEVCMEKFDRLGDFLYHEQSHILGKSYSCEVCMKNYKTLGNFLKHKRTHRAKESFCCRICFKRFSDIESLEGHEIMHLKEQLCCKETLDGKEIKEEAEEKIGPNSCDISKKILSRIDKLQKDKKDKSFTCNECGMIFSSNRAIDMHIRKQHENKMSFQCTICLKILHNEKCLKKHTQEHHRQLSLYCELCKKKFHSKSTLNIHKKVHARHLRKNF